MTSLKTISLSSWKPSSAEHMNSMFRNDKVLTKITLGSSWTVSKVGDFNNMFRECNDLTINCKNWNVKSSATHSAFATNASGVTLPSAW